MIEAVNSVVSNAQVLRAVAEQTSSAQSYSANPARVQSAALVAPYLSPHVDLNGGLSKPVIVIRDAETGDLINQYPTEGQIRAYQQAKEVQDRAVAEAAFQKSTEKQAAATSTAGVAGKPTVDYFQVKLKLQAEQKASLAKSSSSETGGVPVHATTTTVRRITSVDTSV